VLDNRSIYLTVYNVFMDRYLSENLMLEPKWEW
jgi:hypothetical protein